ncbi:uncharacterized protein LTR77_009390 [Saxophila tyrrhenica]|uniref:Uncharacterized protein n=1 Tax=Saxophila tyrrhenica TaxID=1690608 RepID=A0AAV9P2B9_9PEZI|nr:hypothetical protein LTR77_009390 [Saxophila tyrrhenica]
MPVRRYTREQLLFLRSSPLAQKPENLPAIEQWLEYVYADQDSREKLRIPHSDPNQTGGSNSTNPRSRNPQSKVGGAGAGDASPMGNFGAGLRPSLMSARTGRTSEDVSLGPPRTMFPSSRNVAKLSDFGEKGGESNGGDEQELPRTRTFGDKGNRKSANEKEYGDRWTTIRERRNGGEDGQRQEGKYGRRDRDKDDERRNGDSRWGGRDERRQNGDRTSWRDRERDKQDRDWDRGGRAEKKPEWMDDPPPAAVEDDLQTMGIPRDAESFQRWKDAQHGKTVPPRETEPPEPPPAPTIANKPAATLNIEGLTPFGGALGEPAASASTVESSTSVAKPPSKGKSSRFATLWNKDPTPQEEPVVDTKAGPGGSHGSSEDQAGFQRIMQMLGGTNISKGTTPNHDTPSSPPPKTMAGSARQKSRFTPFFDQTPKSPETVQSPPAVGFRPQQAENLQANRGVFDEHKPIFGAGAPVSRMVDQPARKTVAASESLPPATDAAGSRDQPSQPKHQRANDVYQELPPSRGAATPDNSIEDLLAAQRPNKEKAFLLSLLQTKGSRPPSQQARQDDNFSPWLDQPPNVQQEPHAPKPRTMPPPGLFEDQLLRNTAQDPSRQEMPQQVPGSGMPQRHTSQRAPPGFYDEPNIQRMEAQQAQAAAQRRIYNDPVPQMPPGGRRMSGHPNLPPMHMPNHQQQYQPGPPPEFLQSPNVQQGPPPGFPPQMARHPPGIHNMPNMFSAPQQQAPQGRDLSNFGGMAQSGGMQSPPNVPPGFYAQGPPPGFMQMRSPPDGMAAGAGPNMRSGRPFEGGFDNGGRIGGPGPGR